MVRGHRGARLAALIACASLWPMPARAEDEGSGEFSGTSHATAVTDVPSSTRIGLDDAWAGDDDLAGRLETSPSISVRRSGGGGQSAWVAVRGAAPVHTRVMLDGVPLTGGADTSFDLASIPLELLDHVDVFRGWVPLSHGGAAAGGVVDLRTATPDEAGVIASVGGGTLGSRSASLAASGAAGSHELLGVVAMDGAEGDFVFRDDNGTPLELRDDTERAHRENNDHNAVAALVRHSLRAGRWRADTVVVGAFRRAGAPGTIAVDARQSSQQSWRTLVAFRARRPRLLDDHLDVTLGANASLRGLELRDPEQELFTGLSGEYADRARGLGLTAQGVFWPAGPLSLTLRLDDSDEDFVPLASSGRRPAGRNTLGAGAELEAAADFGLSGALQFRLQRLFERGDSDRDDVFAALPAARVGWTTDVGESGEVSLGASAELAERSPGFAELYGAGDLIVGDPELRPERRVGGEVGGNATFEHGSTRLAVDLGAWTRSIDDLIVFYDNGSGVARPRNLDRGELRGIEASTVVAYRDWVMLGTSLSLLDARDGQTGDPLPWRSPWSLDATLSGGYGHVRAQWQVQADAGYSIDEAGLSDRPTRVTHDVRAAWVPCFEPRLRLSVQLDNVFNLREGVVDFQDGGETLRVSKPVHDVLGYPLPGRTFFVSLSFNSGGFE